MPEPHYMGAIKSSKVIFLRSEIVPGRVFWCEVLHYSQTSRGSRFHYQYHFIDEETETQGIQMLCLRTYM